MRFTGQREVPIAPLLPELSFTAGLRNWGIAFRYGLFQIPEADFRRVERQMIGGSISAPP